MRFSDPSPMADRRVIYPIDATKLSGVVLAVDAEGDLLDSSGNGFNLAASLGPIYMTLDGKQGLYSRVAQTIFQATSYGNYPALQILGALTFHVLVHPFQHNPSARAIVAGFLGSGETAAANTLFDLDTETTGQISSFHEYGAGSDERTFFQVGLPLARWSLLTLVRTSGTAYRLFVNGTKLAEGTTAQAPTGGTSARFESSGFVGLWGGAVVANVAQSDTDVLAVAEQVGIVGDGAYPPA